MDLWRWLLPPHYASIFDTRMSEMRFWFFDKLQKLFFHFSSSSRQYSWFSVRLNLKKNVNDSYVFALQHHALCSVHTAHYTSPDMAVGHGNSRRLGATSVVHSVKGFRFTPINKSIDSDEIRFIFALLSGLDCRYCLFYYTSATPNLPIIFVLRMSFHFRWRNNLQQIRYDCMQLR